MLKTAKILLIATVIAGMLSPPTPAIAAGEWQQVVITGYYSPLPNQRYYITGDYEGDIRLNGRGTNGADGTEVYIGMLAAPKNIAFGTKIEIEGFGTGIVNDRGGAIKGNRIDIYTGKGEEGLAKALQIGKRTVTARILRNNSNVLASISVPSASAFTWTRLATMYRKSTPKHLDYYEKLENLGYGSEKSDLMEFQLTHNIITSITDTCAGCMGPGTRSKLDTIYKEIESITPKQGIYEEDKGEEVIKLQQLLYENGLLATKPTGYFGEQTTKAVVQLQLTHNLIEDENHKAAGFIGPGTQEVLRTLALKQFKKLEPTLAKTQETQPIIITTALLTNQETTISSTNAFQVIFENNLSQGDLGPKVAQLQKTLYELGFLETPATGYFGEETTKAVTKYQIEKQIITSHQSPGAGILGPKTRRMLSEEAQKQEKTRIRGSVVLGDSRETG